jgi:1-acyl-sn-glycerol-3-phosphate acyltransferase
MALEAQVPVIPVAMVNTFEIQPPGRLLPRLLRVGVRIGTPLDFTRYEGLEDDRFILRSVTDEVMYALMDLSGQEYVDMYASRAKELISQGSPADSSATRTVNTPTSDQSPD